MACLASLGQPNAHWPQPWQPSMLRRIGSPWRPSACTPRSKSSAFRPMISHGTGRTEMARSTSSKNGAMAAGSAPSTPSSASHARRTRSGVRKHVPEFTTVVPPTHLPRGRGIAGRPNAKVAPPLRYRRWTRSIGGPWKSSCVKYAPSSRTTTRSPARASSCATTAPPAPEPTMQTSAVSSTAPWTSGCWSGARRGPRRVGADSRQSYV